MTRCWAFGRFGESGRQWIYQSPEDDHVITSGAAVFSAPLWPAPKQSRHAKLHHHTLRATLAQSQALFSILQDSLDVSQDVLSSAGGEYQHAAAADLEALQEVHPNSALTACTRILVLQPCAWEGNVDRENSA